jgi:hypothetical protein
MSNSTKLILDLYETVNKNTIAGLAILSLIRSDSFKDDEILSYIQDTARDNLKLMKEVIPAELLERILNYKP